jgi:hypothetical protein
MNHITRTRYPVRRRTKNQEGMNFVSASIAVQVQASRHRPVQLSPSDILLLGKGEASVFIDLDAL